MKYCLQLAESLFGCPQTWRLQAAGTPVDSGEALVHVPRVSDDGSEIKPKDHKFVRLDGNMMLF